MKLPIQLLLLIVTSFLTPIPCLAQKDKPAYGDPVLLPPALVENNPGSWREFEDAEGGFSVLLPATPTRRVKTIKIPNGELRLHTYALKTFAEYTVIYADHPLVPGEPSAAKDFLDRYVVGVLAETKAELLNLEDISIDGHPGKYRRTRLPDGSIMRAKVVLAGRRIYQAAIYTPSEKGAPPETIKFRDAVAAKFLDSFKLLQKGKATRPGSNGASNATSNNGMQPAAISLAHINLVSCDVACAVWSGRG